MERTNIDEICNEILDLLKRDYSKNNEAVVLTKDANIVTELMINSVDAIELLLKIENIYDVEIPDDDLNIDLLQNVQQLAEYIYKL